ncbi:MAG: HAD family phosphatase [Lachnospiraceae bacterium]|nr:HAD family phosphatase [Lachnospiraceae bacterium]
MKDKPNLIFDVGEVLLEYRWKDMLRDYGLCEADALRVGTEVFEDSSNLWSTFDRGIVTMEEIIASYCHKYPADGEAITWFISHGEYMHVPRPAVWKLVHQLKESGFRIYLLSNYPEVLFQKHTEYADFMQDIDGLMVSYMIHQSKPDRAIYEALCDKYGLTPESCLFFDDRLENVQGARDFGMTAVHVTSQESLLEYLRSLL